MGNSHAFHRHVDTASDVRDTHRRVTLFEDGMHVYALSFDDRTRFLVTSDAACYPCHVLVFPASDEVFLAFGDRHDLHCFIFRSVDAHQFLVQENGPQKRTMLLRKKKRPSCLSGFRGHGDLQRLFDTVFSARASRPVKRVFPTRASCLSPILEEEN